MVIGMILKILINIIPVLLILGGSYLSITRDHGVGLVD
jgi:hypothetical protein